MSPERTYTVARWPCSDTKMPSVSLLSEERFLRGCILVEVDPTRARWMLDEMDDGHLLHFWNDTWAWRDRDE